MQTILYGLRKEKGYTQEEMGKYIGVSESAYRMKETGDTQFKMEEMFAIADLFDLPIEQIFLPRKLTKRELVK